MSRSTPQGRVEADARKAANQTDPGSAMRALALTGGYHTRAVVVACIPA